MTERTPPLQYPDIGGTRGGRVPDGFDRLSRSTVAGRGRAAFDRLAEALLRWDVHRGAGLTVEADGPVAEGREVRLFLPGPLRPLPLTIACRVVYLVDEPGRRGFAYGTLPGHVEEGEARFLVETDPGRDDAPVTFSVDAFSRPGRPWVASVAPLARFGQEAATQAYLRAARRIGHPE
ncbi:MAG: DUF1990 family protein [Kineosporiaceae bacterium]